MSDNTWVDRIGSGRDGINTDDMDADTLGSVALLKAVLAQADGKRMVRMPLNQGYLRSNAQIESIVNTLHRFGLNCRYIDKQNTTYSTFWSHYSLKGFVCLSVSLQGWVYMDGNFVVPTSEVYALFQDMEKMKDLRPRSAGPEHTGCLFTFMGDSNNLRISEFDKDAGKPIKRENYTSKVLEGYDSIVTELGVNSPRGRLSILEGPAGTGKSSAIKGMIYELREKCSFLYVPAHLVVGLSNPLNLPVLLRFKQEHSPRKVVLVLEDADKCLINREDTEVSEVAALLNLADGLIGAGLDLRIVATTNEGVKLDEAVKRRGRLFQRLTVANLSRSHATTLLGKLLNNESADFRSQITHGAYISLADTYVEASDQGWKPEENEVVVEEDSNTLSFTHEYLLSLFT
jgi:ATPase family associated with various cellular activities (AAA)